MGFAILVIDIDGTLAATPRPEGNDYRRWAEAIRRANHPPVPGAQSGIRQLLRQHPNASPYLLTARNGDLRAATERWIADHFPSLVPHPLCMRVPGTDHIRSIDMKRERLQLLRGFRPGPMLLVEDDPEAEVLCGERDRLLRAPECWSEAR